MSRCATQKLEPNFLCAQLLPLAQHDSTLQHNNGPPVSQQQTQHVLPAFPSSTASLLQKLPEKRDACVHGLKQSGGRELHDANTQQALPYTSSRGTCLSACHVSMHPCHAYHTKGKSTELYPDGVSIIDLNMWCVVAKGCSAHLTQCSQLVLRQSLQAIETGFPALPKMLHWELSTALHL